MTPQQQYDKFNQEFQEVCRKIEDYINKYEWGLDECENHKTLEKMRARAWQLREDRDYVKYFMLEEAVQ